MDTFELDLYGWIGFRYEGNSSHSWRKEQCREGHQIQGNLSACFSFLQPDGCLICLSPPCLPCRRLMPNQPARLTLARLGPRRVFMAARPPRVRSYAHPMYRGPLCPRVTKNGASAAEHRGATSMKCWRWHQGWVWIMEVYAGNLFGLTFLESELFFPLMDRA